MRIVMKRIILLFVLIFPVFAFSQLHILVAYDTQTGNTEKLAQSIAKGATIPGVEVAVKKMSDVKDETLPTFDAVIIGTPVHWSNMSAHSKEFLDRLGAALWKAKTNGDGRMAGVFCTGGGVSMGKDEARLSTIAALLVMRFTIIGGVDDSGFGTLGPAATTGPADPGLSEKELEEGRSFGERFARMTKQIRPTAQEKK